VGASEYRSIYTAARGVLGACALLGVCVQTLAADADSSFKLGSVEVIGRRESNVTPATTEAVTADDLARTHRDDLSEVLELVPGVNVQNLGQRRERLIYVRGFTSRQVPLFIDGVPVYVPYDGNVDLARFGVDYVSEVVVSKGLASLLYGPNILGGAVNVISRKPSQPFEASIKTALELDDHFDTSDQRLVGSLGGTMGDWYAHLTASYSKSDGYRLSDDFKPVAAENGGIRENAESHDSVVSAKIGYAPSENNEFALSYYRQDGDKQDPPYAGSYLRNRPGLPTLADGVQVRFWQWPYWNKESFYFVARNEIGERGTLRWRLFHDSFENALESYDNATYTTQTQPFAFHGSNYRDYTYGGSVDFEWRWSDQHVTRLATHYRNDVHREAQLAPRLPQQRLEADTYDLAVEHEWRIVDAFTLAGSVSHMIQPGQTVQIFNSGTQTFRSVTTDKDDASNAQLIGIYRLSNVHSLTAGASRKTRFPTLKDRFSGGLGTVVSNPGLQSETAMHYEFGYQLNAAQWTAKAAVFRSDTDDAIQSVSLPASSCTNPPCTQLQNVAGGQRHQGIEVATVFIPIESLRLNAQAALLDVENRFSSVLPSGIPKRKFMVGSDWEFAAHWNLRFDAIHESERVSNSAGTRRADSFTLFNTFLRFETRQQLGLEVGVRNATDKLYAFEEGYFEAGRTWLAQIDLRY